MKTTLLLLCCASVLFLALPANAADYYVSNAGNNGNPGSAGSPWATVTYALSVAACGDNINIQNNLTETFLPQMHACAANNKVTIRSSGYASLPADGYRVHPTTDAANLRTITGTDTTYGTVYIGRPEVVVDENGVDIMTDVITFMSAPTEDMAVTFGDSPSALPAPLVLDTIYYLRDVSGLTAKVAATVGGMAINLTTVGTAASANYYARPRYVPAIQPSGIKILGLLLKSTAGTSPTVVLTMGDSGINSAATASQYIEVSHCVIEGAVVTEWATGPVVGLDLNAINSWVHDSYIYHFHTAFVETKGILVRNLGDNNIIEGNYVSASGINLLTAGQNSPVYERNIQDLTIRHNDFAKEGYMSYSASAGAPPGGAGQGWYHLGSGAYYRNTSVAAANCTGGGCYRAASDGTWTQDTGLPFRSGGNVTKNNLELKDCVRCTIEDNLFRGNPESSTDAGQGWCMGYSILGAGSQAYHRGEYITLKNNWCKFTWGGLWATGDGATVAPLSNNTIYNNLVTNLRAPVLAMTPVFGDISESIRLLTPQPNLLVDHNTVRLDDLTSVGAAGIMVVKGTLGGVSTMTPGYVQNSIFSYNTYGLFIANDPDPPADGTCGAGGLLLWTANPSSPKYLANTVSYNTAAGNNNYGTCDTAQNWKTNTDAAMSWVSSTNPRLSTSSPYSATICSPFCGTDGTDLGADPDKIEMKTSGVEAGLPTWNTRMSFTITRGSTTAVATYTRPGAGACNFTLYTAAPRITGNEHADTNTSGEKLDTRTGNTVVGDAVTFNLGFNTPLTPSTQYWYSLSCVAADASTWLLAGDSFTTTASGSRPPITGSARSFGASR